MVLAVVVGVLLPVADAPVLPIGDEARQTAIGVEGEPFPYAVGVGSLNKIPRRIIAALFHRCIVECHLNQLAVDVILVFPEIAFHLS